MEQNWNKSKKKLRHIKRNALIKTLQNKAYLDKLYATRSEKSSLIAIINDGTYWFSLSWMKDHNWWGKYAISKNI